MAGAMKGVTKALISMNKKMDLPGLQKVMADFMRENEKSEITQEALAEAMDDAMEEEGSSEQEDNIVNQVNHILIAGIWNARYKRQLIRLVVFLPINRFWMSLELVSANQCQRPPVKPQRRKRSQVKKVCNSLTKNSSCPFVYLLFFPYLIAVTESDPVLSELEIRLNNLRQT